MTVPALTTTTMDLPSARELELEAALRQRNAQVSDLIVNFCLDTAWPPLIACSAG